MFVAKILGTLHCLRGVLLFKSPSFSLGYHPGELRVTHAGKMDTKMYILTGLHSVVAWFLVYEHWCLYPTVVLTSTPIDLKLHKVYLTRSISTRQARLTELSVRHLMMSGSETGQPFLHFASLQYSADGIYRASKLAQSLEALTASSSSGYSSFQVSTARCH
ncbi:hypothetical protein EIP91_009868 [Steccherinum ochraceum]|uniref:Uncharacterized protein n=1 Tax=Steccherinum ochraceum TaxID=92696 RepID=A0A4R0R153_9APHY|nr:hypothetical protein EIP91_009868 [Steccherinum ochraceum]